MIGVGETIPIPAAAAAAAAAVEGAESIRPTSPGRWGAMP